MQNVEYDMISATSFGPQLYILGENDFIHGPQFHTNYFNGHASRFLMKTLKMNQ